MKRRYLICLVLCLSELAVRPAHAQTETVLYNFQGSPDGANPASSLSSDGKGNFYGTTYQGGLGYGIVFEVSPDGNGGWNETVLYSFTGGTDGSDPSESNVTFDSAGNLYGTAAGGGDLTCHAPYGCGVVFELSPVGENWAESVLYSFTGGTDGAVPLYGVIMDPAGNLYGSNEEEGVNRVGTVFELSPSGGRWTEQTIYAGAQGGGYYSGGLAMDAAGNIFGTTSLNLYSQETAFELSPNGNGGWNPTVICTFNVNFDPEGTIAIDKAGNLYGAAFDRKYGVIYKLTHQKSGKWTRRNLYAFNGFAGGDGPTGIVIDAAGNIYGTTGGGGTYGYGTVFDLVAPVGKGKYTENVLWSFDGADGWGPNGVILDSAGNLYGTTYYGGSSPHNWGVVFEVTP